MTTLAQRALPVVALATLLAACGGGSGGDSGIQSPPVISPAPVVTSVDVIAAWHDYTTTAHTWTMPGKGSDARAFELSVVMKPGVDGAFALTGASGRTIDQSLRFKVDGANTVTSDGTLFLNGDTMIGVSTTNGACTGVRGAATALPGASQVGANGPMFVLDGYAGCATSGQRLGATTFSWSVESDGALTMFCIASRQEDGSGAYIGTEVDCMEASPDGTLGNKAKFTITRPDGSSITGKNY